MYMPNGTKLPRLKTLYRLYQLKVTIVSFPALVRASYSVACFLRTASLFFFSALRPRVNKLWHA